MRYKVTMYNPKSCRTENYLTSTSKPGEEYGLEQFKDFLSVLESGGYKDITFKPVPEDLSAEQHRICDAINQCMDTSKMSLFVTGANSIHVEDATGEIDFYTQVPDGPVYDSFHGVVPFDPVAP